MTMTSSVQIQKDSKPEVSVFIHTELYEISNSFQWDSPKELSTAGKRVVFLALFVTGMI